MSNLTIKGIDCRQTGSQLVFRSLLQDSAGDIVPSGVALLYLYELQSSGYLKSYDFGDDTFKYSALTFEKMSGVQQKGNNATHDTGIWTHTLNTLTGFTINGIYLTRVNHLSAMPPDQYREFQYGGDQGDLAVTQDGTGNSYIKSDLLEMAGSKTAATRLSSSAKTICSVTIGTGSTDTVLVTSTIDPTTIDTDQFAGRVLLFPLDTTTTGLRGQGARIASVTSGGVITLQDALSTSPVNGDLASIV